MSRARPDGQATRGDSSQTDGTQADAEVIDLARSLSRPPRPGDADGAARLLAALPTARTGRRQWAFPALAAVVVMGAALGWFARSLPRSDTVGPLRGQVQAAQGARFSHERVESGGSVDEVVRLHEGKLAIDVASLATGERFRVVTGDAEVEVHGTRLEVTAAADALQDVQVHSGVVSIRPWQGVHRHLMAGQQWHRGQEPTPSPPAAAAPRPPTAAPVVEAPPPQPAPASVQMAVATEGQAPPALGRATAPRARLPGHVDTAAGRAAADTEAPQAAEVPTEPSPGAAPSGSSEAEAAFAEGWSALRRLEFGKAAAAFAAVTAAGDSAGLAEDARYWRAVALSRGHEAAAALAAWREFLARHPSSRHVGEARAMLGWALLDAGEPAQALPYFEAAARDAAPAVRASATSGRDAARQRLLPQD